MSEAPERRLRVASMQVRSRRGHALELALPANVVIYRGRQPPDGALQTKESLRYPAARLWFIRGKEYDFTSQIIKALFEETGRNFLVRRGFSSVAACARLYQTSRRTTLRAKVISVGNLTTGGSGKTPMTLYLAERPSKPSILTRGYRRQSTANVVLAAASAAWSDEQP
jgi:hypothetical protein